MKVRLWCLLFITIAGGALMQMVGCGGGGGSTAPLVSAVGRVVLPSGSKATLTTLQAVSAAGTSPVKSDGSFKVSEHSTSPAIVQLTDTSGNLVMLGFSSSTAGPGEVSANTTAQILLFYAIGAEALPADQYAQALATIAAAPQTTQLAGTVSTRIAADTTALNDDDPQIDTAVATAAAALAPPPATTSSLAATPPTFVSRASVTVTAPTRDANNGQILIQPTGLQSGVEIIQNPNGAGIVVVNNFRRTVDFFLYKTGTTDTSGNVTNFPLVQPVGGTHTVPSVTKINGVFGTLTDLINNKIAYAPVNSSPVTVSLDAGTQETRYEVVVLGFSTTTLAPAIFTDPRYAQQTTSLQSAYSNLMLDAFVREFLLNIVVTSVFAPNDIQSILSDPTEVSSLVSDLSGLLTSVPGIVDDLKAGKPVNAFSDLSVAMTNNSGLREAFVTQLLKLPSVAKITGTLPNASTILKNFTKANSLLKAAELALTAGDIARLLHDWANANEAEVWSIKVEQFNVRLSPATATVSVGTQTVALTAIPGVPGDPTAPFVYNWSVSGSAGGGLEDGTHTSGKDTNFDSTDSLVSYAEAATAQNGAADTVTVQMFFNAGTLSHPSRGARIGQAQSVITVNNSGCGTGVPGTVIASGCGDMTVVSSSVSPGGHLIVNVNFHAGGVCGGAAAVSLNSIPVTSVTLDGTPQTSAIVPVTNGVHTVDFQIAPDAQPCSGTQVANSDPNLFIPTIFGPWVLLSEGSGGNSNGWTTQMPITIK